MTGTPPGETCPFCGGDEHEVARFDAPPAGETDYGLHPYERRLARCGRCGHVRARHAFDLTSFYADAYTAATYGDAAAATFARIMALPADRSDNRARAAFVDARAAAIGLPLPRTLLDVGSGLAVFPAAMRELGWTCTALDPDERAAHQARRVANVDAVCADFTADDLVGRWDVVTFNKVLEHVVDPVAMLARARGHLSGRGFVYVELPDAEAALVAGPDREEFFVEHYHAFSAASLTLLSTRAGFRVDVLERVHEPSDKFTLRAVLGS